MPEQNQEQRRAPSGARVDLSRFAAEIGVSPTTISHALSGRGRVSASTREMVLRRMAELGYVPNRHAQQLASGRSGFLLVHSSAEAESLPDTFVMRQMLAVEWAARRRGYVPIFDAPTRDEGLRFLTDTVRSRTVAGTILLDASHIPDDTLASLAAPDHPVVRIAPYDYPLPPNVGQVVMDVGVGVRQLVELLTAQGHQRVGAIITSSNDSVWTAFAAEAAACGLEVPPELVLEGFAPTAAEGARGLRTWMEKAQDTPGSAPVTAVFVRKDDMALGALAAAREWGLCVPEDLSIASFDDLPLATYTYPSLTTVGLNVMDIGERVVETLHNLISPNNSDTRESTPPVGRIEAYLAVRDSVGPAPSAPPRS